MNILTFWIHINIVSNEIKADMWQSFSLLTQFNLLPLAKSAYVYLQIWNTDKKRKIN